MNEVLMFMDKEVDKKVFVMMNAVGDTVRSTEKYKNSWISRGFKVVSVESGPLDVSLSDEEYNKLKDMYKDEL